MARAKTASGEQIISSDWTVAEIVAHYPGCTGVLTEWGFHCMGCSVGGIETLEEAGVMHGLTEEDLGSLVEDLNDVIASIPARPRELHVTKEAALAIREIALEEKMGDQGLSVQANEDGSFFMEFRESSEEGEKEFINADVPEVKVWASVLTLQRIGGAVVCFREGRFTLEADSSSCCNEKQCDCEAHGCCCDNSSTLVSSA